MLKANEQLPEDRAEATDWDRSPLPEDVTEVRMIVHKLVRVTCF